jgi:hypothetical protein
MKKNVEEAIRELCIRTKDIRNGKYKCYNERKKKRCTK